MLVLHARSGGWLAVVGRAASPSEKTARPHIVSRLRDEVKRSLRSALACAPPAPGPIVTGSGKVALPAYIKQQSPAGRHRREGALGAKHHAAFERDGVHVWPCSRNGRQSHLREDERAHSWVVIGSGAARLLMTGPEVDKTYTISDVSPCKQDRRSVRSARGVEEQR